MQFHFDDMNSPSDVSSLVDATVPGISESSCAESNALELDESIRDSLVPPSMSRDVVESLLMDQGLMNHHIDSMNSFWTKELPQIVQENATIVYEHKHGEERWVVRISHLEIERPTYTDADGIIHKLWPHEALHLRQTYAATQRNTVTVWKQVRMLKQKVSDS